MTWLIGCDNCNETVKVKTKGGITRPKNWHTITYQGRAYKHLCDQCFQEDSKGEEHLNPII